MNIIISTLVSPSEVTGVGKYILQLIDELQKENEGHKFFILVNNEFDELIKITNPDFKKIKVPIPHYPRFIMRPMYFLWQNYSDLILSHLNADVIHLPNQIPLFRKGKLPYVITIHDVAEFSLSRYGAFRHYIRKKAMKNCSEIASEIITVSEFSKSEIVKYLSTNSSKVSVSPLGFKNQKVEERINRSRPYFLHVGGYRKHKNLIALFKAFKNLRTEEQIDLVIVGRRKGLEQVEKIANESGVLDNVKLLGYVSDAELYGLYRNAIALIYPSLYEGFGLPIIEAMSCGTPVITSNCTSMPEVGGDAACYCDPRDIDSIREAMQKVIDDKPYRSWLAKKGLERSKLYTWRKTAIKTIEVYKKAAMMRK